MINNKVIIDGVEISNCQQYISKYQEPNNLEGGYKTFYKVCECGTSGVEDYNFYCKDNPPCYYKQLQRKTQECEKLKKEAVYGYVGDLSNKLRALVFSELNKENQKLKSALEEIEDIIKPTVNLGEMQLSIVLVQQIQDIIDKAKEQE